MCSPWIQENEAQSTLYRAILKILTSVCYFPDRLFKSAITHFPLTVPALFTAGSDCPRSATIITSPNPRPPSCIQLSLVRSGRGIPACHQVNAVLFSFLAELSLYFVSYCISLENFSLKMIFLERPFYSTQWHYLRNTNFPRIFFKLK